MSLITRSRLSVLLCGVFLLSGCYTHHHTETDADYSKLNAPNNLIPQLIPLTGPTVVTSNWYADHPNDIRPGAAYEAALIRVPIDEIFGPNYTINDAMRSAAQQCGGTGQGTRFVKQNYQTNDRSKITAYFACN